MNLPFNPTEQDMAIMKKMKEHIESNESKLPKEILDYIDEESWKFCQISDFLHVYYSSIVQKACRKFAASFLLDENWMNNFKMISITLDMIYPDLNLFEGILFKIEKETK